MCIDVINVHNTAVLRPLGISGFIGYTTKNNMARKLASIQIIKELQPIANSDTLAVASVLGWKCVVKKNEFEVGDKCIYCEIDSILPEKPEFEFLKKNKYRVRTIRLRGQISQGLSLQLNYLPNLGEDEASFLKEGEDVTERMSITQWVPQIPTCLTSEVKGAFPNFIPKTDETRVQVLQDILDRFVGVPCYVTEKIDGSSVTYFLSKDGEFGVCSRNLELKDSEKNSQWKLAKQLKIEEKLRKAFEDTGYHYAIQGEIFGPSIQGNPLKQTEQNVLIYNVFNIENYEYLSYGEFIEFCNTYEIKTVPIVADEVGLTNSIELLVAGATRKSLLNPAAWAEGVVIRPMKERVDLQMSNFGMMANGRVSFKVINPEYLLEEV